VSAPAASSRADGGARRALGAAGEALVATWYEDRGWTVADRNWRVARGEIDLVLARGRERVFCEVKTRRSDRFGAPSEAVGYTKQQRLRTLALAWLDAKETHHVQLRFDVASVLVALDGLASIDVVEAAF
jgi:putative endonuclease